MCELHIENNQSPQVHTSFLKIASFNKVITKKQREKKKHGKHGMACGNIHHTYLMILF